MKLSGLGFLILSLPAMVALFPYSVANAALRVDNSSQNNRKAQINAERAAATLAQTAEPAPARVLTDSHGQRVSVSAAEMDACNSIYPGGDFDWRVPTAGRKKAGAATCVSLVELRGYTNSIGTEYKVLATAYLAAGDSMNCNIDDFDNITPAGAEFEYPADNPPTREEVAAVMAQENKSHAGFKILAAALVGGVGGNLIGKNDPGKDSMVGLSKDKLKTTALGAAGAAAVMTASTQINNYKAGSIILSTGMNAAAGAVAGNVMASGDDVIKIDTCPPNIKPLEGKTCVYGSYEKDSSGAEKYDIGEGKKLFFDLNSGGTYECTKVKDTDNDYNNCHAIGLTGIQFEGIDSREKIEVCKEEAQVNSAKCRETLRSNEKTVQYAKPTEDKGVVKKQSTRSNSCKDCWIAISSANSASARMGAVALVKPGFSQKLMGYKYSDWTSSRKDIIGESTSIYDMYGNAVASPDVSKFSPAAQGADDGSIVDLGNKARAKSTMIGAGAGAGLGALSGASGADAAIEERWQAEQENYKASLLQIGCSTGTRYLSGYNTAIALPEMKIQE